MVRMWVLGMLGGASAQPIHNAIELRVYSTITTVRFYESPVERMSGLLNLFCTFMSSQCPRPFGSIIHPGYPSAPFRQNTHKTISQACVFKSSTDTNSHALLNNLFNVYF